LLLGPEAPDPGSTARLWTRSRAHGVGGVRRPRVRDPSPARRIRRLGHRTARCALGALLSVDAPVVPAGLRAGSARPTIVLAVSGVVRLCPPLEIDGGEPSRRAVDPGGLSAPTPRRVPRMGERVRTAGLPGEDPVRPAGRCRIGA